MKTPDKLEHELSHIAGLIHEAAVRFGMKIGEREIHLDLPAYAQAGFDVDYQPGTKDLSFYNPFDFEVLVGVVYMGDVPILTFSGAPSATYKAPKITVTKEPFQQEKQILTDFTLVGRGEVRRSDGAPGQMVKVFVDAKNDGKNELAYKDFYAPKPVVIARGPSAEELKANEIKP